MMTHEGPGGTNDLTGERMAYSVNEATQLTGLSRDLLYDEMRRGHLRYLKVARRRLITRQHLEEFLEMVPGLPPGKGSGSGSAPGTVKDAR